MAGRAPRRRARGARRRERGGREWVGGCLSPPFFITDRDEPYRPGFVVWMDVSDGLVLGQDVVAPEDAEGAVGRALLAAMARPLAGPPRRPDRIRVADARLADEVRAALGDDTPVAIAPTPELDALLERMLESMSQEGGDDGESYFEDGRIPPAAVAELFRSADLLYGLAPWKVATDDQVLRMDIPALGVEGACVSIIGNLGESLGVLIFPSLAGYEAFGEAGDELARGGSPGDFGTDLLSLGFERGADLPLGMRREVAEHGWPVADANAYPRVERRERDGASRPLVERDVKIASACATSLSAFFAQHRSLFEADEIEPVCESWFDEHDLEVRFTVPYEAFGLFDVEDAPRRPPSKGPRVGRNDPCPCGSGKKYKKCHLASDEADRASERERAGDHDLDGELVHELSAYAMARFGFEWSRFTQDFVDSSGTLQLAVPWSVYQYRVQGRSVPEWYLAEHGRGLSRAERGWLAAQQAAWLSVWEVIGVEAGKTVTLRDLLSHEERCVREVSGSQTLVVRDALLARVVDHEGVSLLCGAHPRPLPPTEAADLVRRARGRLRRKRAVPVERLRDEPFGRYLIKRWEETVTELDLYAAIPPQLHNTDGDPFLLTTDHFELEQVARAEVERCLAGMEGVEAENAEGDAGQDGSAYVFLTPGNPMHTSWENTVTGRACLEGTLLRLETNSRERADALRERVEAACGGLLRHRVREHTDPLSPSAQAAATSAPPETPPPEAEQLLLDFKRRYYADWIDQHLPALGGLSPREAVRTARGRDAVDVLLKDMENHEHRSSEQSLFDFGELRRELKLE
jgi:hypothetical protein